MSDLMITFTIFVAGFFTLLYLLNRPKKFGKNGLPYPPCLPSLPILGSALFLTKFQKMAMFFTDNFEKYGPIVGFYMGSEFGLILNTKEAMHEAFIKAEFSTRPFMAFDKLLNPERKGLFSHPYTEEFKKNHRLAINIMKEFGYGSRIMENRIQIELEKLIQNFKKFEGKEFNPSDLTTICSMNVMCSILFGERYDESDPDLSELIELVHNTFRNFGMVFLLQVLKFLIHVPYFKSFVQNSIQIKNRVLEIVEEKAKTCTDPVYSQEKPNFIEKYIEMEGPVNDRPQLLHLIHDLLLAGTETTSSMLQWALIFMANNISIQEKMRDELKKVVPNDRLPSLNDKPNLIYVEASVLELIRFKSAAPTSVPHTTISDCQLSGYFIPADTFVLGNIYCAHFNPKIWGDPDVFRPERFIKDGQIINKDLLVPFSIGKRSCFGEIMAKQEIFLAVASLVQHFKILPPAGQDEIKFGDVYDVTLKPTPFNVRLISIDCSC